jgi:hypothetical protein
MLLPVPPPRPLLPFLAAALYMLIGSMGLLLICLYVAAAKAASSLGIFAFVGGLCLFPIVAVGCVCIIIEGIIIEGITIGIALKFDVWSNLVDFDGFADSVALPFPDFLARLFVTFA